MTPILTLASPLGAFASRHSLFRSNIRFAVLAVLLSSAVICHLAFAAQPRPNILLIVADDLGWGDVS